MAKVECTYCKTENIVSDAVIIGNLGDIKVDCSNCGKTFIIPGAARNKGDKRSFFEKLFSKSHKASDSVVIGEHQWMVENLDVSKFRNGASIPEIRNNKAWIEAIKNGKPAWCYYKNKSSNGKKYGKIYNRYAICDSRGLAPEGYRIPTERDWAILVDYLGGRNTAGDKMKETGTANWESPNSGSTNESGFTALPGGCRERDGSFRNMGTFSLFWSLTGYNATDEEYFLISRDKAITNTYVEGVAFYVRCLKD